MNIYITRIDMTTGNLAHFAQEGWDFKIGESLHNLRQAGLVVRELTIVADNVHVENHKDEIRDPVPQHSTVYFFIKKGAIDKVRWEFYLD